MTDADLRHNDVPAPPLPGDILAGISIADSPDLEDRGLSALHQKDAFLEIARHLLACGASLAYGGDLRLGGFTEELFNLVQTYDKSRRPPPDRIRNYLAWTVARGVSVADRAKAANTAKLIDVGLPSDLTVADKSPIDKDGPEARYLSARCLSEMRDRMTREIGVRVVLGGKVAGYSGKYPGIVEETYLAMLAGKPVYILGGFGGAAYAIAQALQGEIPKAFSLEFQAQTPGYSDMVTLYNARHRDAPIDYESLVSTFHHWGITGLNNGLDTEENARLFQTDHVDEIIALLLRGLRSLRAVGNAARA